MVQLRTGHAFLGQYYHRFLPSEDPSCSCGTPIETREHILIDCPLYCDHRDVLRDKDGILSLADLLGKKEGIKRVAEFINESGAYEKKSPP
jgi:hypothetical protein